MEWRINSCNNGICSSLVQLPRMINKRSQNIYIPPDTLDFGIYRFNFTVQVWFHQQRINRTITNATLKKEELVYIEISQSTVTDNLVQFGTSEITASHRKDLILDPGRYSEDPGRGEFNASVSTFFFTY